jgi:outer membrane protein assembly factor BamB
MSVSDYFSPCDQQTLSNSGNDLGSSAPVLLPDSAGSPSEPHLMMGGAKNGSLYVLNRDSLGQFNSSCPDLPNRAQVVPVGDGPILSTPLFWNNTIYVAAGNGALKAFPISGGVLNSSPLMNKSAETLGPQGATPAISSNGTNNAIVWLIDSSGAFSSPNTPSIVRAFDASNLSNEVYNSAMVPSRDTAGLAVKFTVPTVANGKVYVGTQSELDVYGLLY